MKKSGWALSVAASLVAAGVALAAGAYWTSTGVEAQSTVLPETLAFVPRTAKVVGHFNLTSFSNSPLREKWEQALEKRGGTTGLDEFREMTGLDPFRDIVSVSFAFVPRENQPEASPPLAARFGVALHGRFDGKKLLDKIAENATVEPEDYRGTTIYHVSHGGEKGGDESGFAFSSRDTVLFGEVSFLKEMIDTGAGRRASVGSTLTAEWGEGNFAEDTFWVAASPRPPRHESHRHHACSVSRNLTPTGRIQPIRLMGARCNFLSVHGDSRADVGKPPHDDFAPTGLIGDESE